MRLALAVKFRLGFSAGLGGGHDRADAQRRDQSVGPAGGHLSRLRDAAIADPGDGPESHPRCRESA